MTFFARPNLDDIQFKQLTGSTLTLSGTTIINSQSGLTLTGDYGRIPIVIENETNDDVFTYKNGCIVLAQPTISTVDVVYPYNDKVTCAVGGISLNTCLCDMKVVDILQRILVPVMSPTLTPPSTILNVLPNNPYFEVGTSVAITANTTYNRGCVSPVYCNGPSTRTGLPMCYTYTNINGIQNTKISTLLSDTNTLPSVTIQNGNNSVSVLVCYSAGEYPKKSDGTNVNSCCPNGSCGASVNLCGLYPYYWGSSINAPSASQSLINNANSLNNVCVAPSNNNVVVNNYNISGEYIWLAIPKSSTTKTKWQGSNSPTNCGTIPGDLFLNEQIVSINSPNGYWSNIEYKFYISRYATSINYQMTFKNS